MLVMFVLYTYIYTYKCYVYNLVELSGDANIDVETICRDGRKKAWGNVHMVLIIHVEAFYM